jgi:hypothetical protein
VLRTNRHVTVAAVGAAALLAALPYAVLRPLARATLEGAPGSASAWRGGLRRARGPRARAASSRRGCGRYAEREGARAGARRQRRHQRARQSVFAIILSVWFGIPATFEFAAGALYLVAALSGPHGGGRCRGRRT